MTVKELCLLCLCILCVVGAVATPIIAQWLWFVGPEWLREGSGFAGFFSAAFAIIALVAGAIITGFNYVTAADDRHKREQKD